MDRTSTNVKVSQHLMKELSERTDGKLTHISELRLETSFVHEVKRYFILFYIVYIIKNIRNALFRNVNHFVYPKLVLSTGHVLEAGVYLVKWIRYLNHKNKEYLFQTLERAEMLLS